MPQQRFSIGAFAVIFDEHRRVLLCHRRDVDAWNLPGGGVESGELPDQAAIRETKEEVGLEVEVERLVGVYGKPEKDEFIFAFHCRVVGGALVATDESDENRYFALDALPPNMSQKAAARIRDAAARHSQPIIRFQMEPSLRVEIQDPPRGHGSGSSGFFSA